MIHIVNDYAYCKPISDMNFQSLSTLRRLNEVIGYKTKAFANGLSGLDVVFDTIGGKTKAKLFGVLRQGKVVLALF